MEMKVVSKNNADCVYVKFFFLFFYFLKFPVVGGEGLD